MKSVIEYHYRGVEERGYDQHSCEVYSANGEDGGESYPWFTKSECKSEAKKAGAKAKFIKDGISE